MLIACELIDPGPNELLYYGIIIIIIIIIITAKNP